MKTLEIHMNLDLQKNETDLLQILTRSSIKSCPYI